MISEGRDIVQNKLGKKLFDLRKKSRMTQEEVADKLGVTRQTVSNWELGSTKPDIDQIKGLSKLYKISLDELIDNDIKETLNEKVSNVEKLSGLIYKLLKVFIIIVIGWFILILLGIVFFSANRTSSISEIESRTELNCMVNDEMFFIIVRTRNDEILELDGSYGIIEYLNLESYTSVTQIINKVWEFVVENDGICE